MIIEFKNVTYTIPNGDTLFKDLNFRLFSNEYYGLLGENGAGKSTFIEMIMGLRKLAKGKIVVFGEEPSATSRTQKDKIFVLTHDMQIPGHILVKDLFAYYRSFYPKYNEETEKELLALFEIDPKKKFGSLSTGQKIKAILCTAFACEADLYLFDEVTAVLDPRSRKNFFYFLKKFRSYHECSIILATNIAEDLIQSVEKVIFIDAEHRALIKKIDEIERIFNIENMYKGDVA